MTLLRRASTPEGLVCIATLLFIAISAWWLAVDSRVPSADSGKHLLISFGVFDNLSEGHPRNALLGSTGYPPFAHLVAAAGCLVGGVGRVSAILAENVVFVPLLAGGCYVAGWLAYDRLTGLAAALFALAVPMVISLFHEMMLDTPMAALVAATVALAIASRRFERTALAAAAGLAFGLGAITKQTFVIFLAGFLVVIVLRGVWRNWRGLLAFAGVALIVAAPWYLEHASDVAARTEGAASGPPSAWYGDVPYPSRWSLDNFAWYGWSLVNNTLYLPLVLLFLVGLAFAVRRALRSDRGWEPELLAGAAFSYVGISLLQLDDPRYLLPWLVYVALIATAWFRELPHRWRVAAIVGVAAVLVVNTAVQNLGIGSTVRISLWNPSSSPIGERTLTILSPNGYVVGPPEEDGGPVPALLERARAEGARRIAFDDASVSAGGYHPSGLAVQARAAGLEVVYGDLAAQLDGSDVYMFTAPLGAEPACAETGGLGIYLSRGGPPGPDHPVSCQRAG